MPTSGSRSSPRFFHESFSNITKVCPRPLHPAASIRRVVSVRLTDNRTLDTYAPRSLRPNQLATWRATSSVPVSAHETFSIAERDAQTRCFPDRHAQACRAMSCLAFPAMHPTRTDLSYNSKTAQCNFHVNLNSYVQVSVSEDIHRSISTSCHELIVPSFFFHTTCPVNFAIWLLIFPASKTETLNISTSISCDVLHKN